MSKKVRLFHPLTNRTILVSEKAARVHRRSGWVDAEVGANYLNERHPDSAEFHGPAGAPDEPTPTGVDNDDPGTGEE